MAQAHGFHCEAIEGASARRAPLVLLHGSGSAEGALLAFGRRIAADRAIVAVRGRVPWQDGYAFFRRNPDRTLDREDLAERCGEFCRFLGGLVAPRQRGPLLVGFSNGAIMAAAAIVRAPALTSGAVLLRPLSPSPEADFPALTGYPVLLVGGLADTRRDPSDTPYLAAQFRRAGASVTEHVLPAGHALDETGADASLARDWLAARD